MTMSAAVEEDYDYGDYEDEDEDEDEDDKDVFIRCIHEKRKVRLTFYAKELRWLPPADRPSHGVSVVRTCAPMDFGPSRQSKNGPWDRYHLWDYDSPSGRPHTLSILPDEAEGIEALNESFDPGEFVAWDTSWFVERDWGPYS